MPLRWGAQGKLKGFPALFVNDMQLAPEVQRKGVGKHVLSLLELMARKHKMTFMMLKIFKGNDAGKALALSRAGFAQDDMFCAAVEPIEIIQKCLCPGDLEKEGVSANARAWVKTPKKKAADEAVTPPTSPGDEAPAAGASVAHLGSKFSAALQQVPTLQVVALCVRPRACCAGADGSSWRSSSRCPRSRPRSGSWPSS